MSHTVAPGQSRLARIITGAVREPDRILVQGVEGVGKTTFGSHAPDPIFITTEEGASQIGVARMTPETYKDAVADLKALIAEEHGYKTVVIDTLDALEPLIWKNVATRNAKDNIEDLGYGKGYLMALDEWIEILRLLDNLRKARGMEVILLAHTVAKNFSNPAGPDYMRYEPALNKQAANLLKGWVDNTLFATYEGGAVGADGKIVTDLQAKGKIKGIETGRRIMKTRRSAAWDAKNRLDLPPEMDFSYAAYAAGREAYWKAKASYIDPRPIYAECLAALDLVEASDKKASAAEFVEKHKGDGPALKKALERINLMKKEDA